MADPIKVLFVCLGNICRSPMAEGMFIHLVRQRGLENQFEIDSAGTSAFHEDERPDYRMRKTAKAHGIELTSRSRPVRDEDFSHYDYILAMDQNNLRDLNTHQSRLNIQHPNLKRIREYDPEPGNLSVPDPYYGGDAGFEEVYQILKRSCEAMLDQIMADQR